MKKHISTAFVVIAAFAAWMPTHAFAEAELTFLSSSGNDVNLALDCSRDKPCRWLNTAARATSNFGTIVILDSGHYGVLSIHNSLSVIAPPGIYAEVSGPSGDDVASVDISGRNLQVVLKGLTIKSPYGDANGIKMQSSSGLSYLSIEDSTIDGLIGTGLLVSGLVHVQITGTEFRNNLVGASFREGAQATITRSKFFSNRKYAVEAKAESGGTLSSYTTVLIKDSIFQGTVSFPESAAFRVDLYPGKPRAYIRFSDSIVTGNNRVRSIVGISDDALVESYGNNAIFHNGGDQTVSRTVKLQ